MRYFSEVMQPILEADDNQFTAAEIVATWFVEGAGGLAHLAHTALVAADTNIIAAEDHFKNAIPMKTTNEAIIGVKNLIVAMGTGGSEAREKDKATLLSVLFRLFKEITCAINGVTFTAGDATATPSTRDTFHIASEGAEEPSAKRQRRD